MHYRYILSKETPIIDEVFKVPAQFDTYEKADKFCVTIKNDINKMREAAGLQPITAWVLINVPTSYNTTTFILKGSYEEKSVQIAEGPLPKYLENYV